jgi:hypothetical protein
MLNVTFAKLHVLIKIRRIAESEGKRTQIFNNLRMHLWFRP